MANLSNQQKQGNKNFWIRKKITIFLIFPNEELRECFNLFDVDKSGSISSKELKKVIEALGISANENEMNGLMKLMDKDGSGAIDFEEFATVMGAQFYKQPSKKDLEEAFKYFDKDSSGTIMFIIKTWDCFF